MDDYFGKIGHPIPGNTNPAEFLLDIVSSDFSKLNEDAQARVEDIQQSWTKSVEAESVNKQISDRLSMAAGEKDNAAADDMARPGSIRITAALLHRSFIKSYRDVVAYGIRIVMYLGMSLFHLLGWPS